MGGWGGARVPAPSSPSHFNFGLNDSFVSDVFVTFQ